MTNSEEPNNTDKVGLYRCFDADGQLLYVGIGFNPYRRVASHRNTRWWTSVARTEVSWFDDARAASEAECAAIRAESPLYNVVGASTAYFPHGSTSRRLDSCSPSGIPAKEYLSVTQVAERVGLSRNTIKTYGLTPGRLPDPDAFVGRARGWLPETVDAWIARRGG